MNILFKILLFQGNPIPVNMLTKLFEKKNKYLCVAVHKVESGGEKKCFL